MGLDFYLVASFIEGLGGLIPIKTSGDITQFLSCVVFIVIMFVHVDFTSVSKFFVWLIILAVILSFCNLLSIALVHLLAINCFEWCAIYR